MFWGKVGAFFGGKLGKTLIVIGALIALAGVVRVGVSAVKNWQERTYTSGLEAGRAEIRGQWDRANNAALLAQIKQIGQDVERSNQSVETYLNGVAQQNTRIVETKERTVVYAASPDGGTVCLDADGVRLVQAARANLGFPAAPAPATPGTVPGALPVAGAAADKH